MKVQKIFKALNCCYVKLSHEKFSNRSRKNFRTTAKRIVVIGTSGTGKTFLGSKLSIILGMKFVDLDDINWLPGWKQRSDEDFIECIKKELSCDEWVVSGNYSRANKYIWPQADMITWIDLPLFHCL